MKLENTALIYLASTFLLVSCSQNSGVKSKSNSTSSVLSPISNGANPAISNGFDTASVRSGTTTLLIYAPSSSSSKSGGILTGSSSVSKATPFSNQGILEAICTGVQGAGVMVCSTVDGQVLQSSSGIIKFPSGSSLDTKTLYLLDSSGNNITRTNITSQLTTAVSTSETDPIGKLNKVLVAQTTTLTGTTGSGGTSGSSGTTGSGGTLAADRAAAEAAAEAATAFAMNSILNPLDLVAAKNSTVAAAAAANKLAIKIKNQAGTLNTIPLMAATDAWNAAAAKSSANFQEIATAQQQLGLTTVEAITNAFAANPVPTALIADEQKLLGQVASAAAAASTSATAIAAKAAEDAAAAPDDASLADAAKIAKSDADKSLINTAYVLTQKITADALIYSHSSDAIKTKTENLLGQALILWTYSTNTTTNLQDILTNKIMSNSIAQLLSDDVRAAIAAIPVNSVGDLLNLKQDEQQLLTYVSQAAASSAPSAQNAIGQLKDNFSVSKEALLASLSNSLQSKITLPSTLTQFSLSSLTTSIQGKGRILEADMLEDLTVIPPVFAGALLTSLNTNAAAAAATLGINSGALALKAGEALTDYSAKASAASAALLAGLPTAADLANKAAAAKSDALSKLQAAISMATSAQGPLTSAASSAEAALEAAQDLLAETTIGSRDPIEAAIRSAAENGATAAATASTNATTAVKSGSTLISGLKDKLATILSGS